MAATAEGVCWRARALLSRCHAFAAGRPLNHDGQVALVLQLKLADQRAAEGAADAGLGQLRLLHQLQPALVAALVLAHPNEQLRAPATRTLQAESPSHASTRCDRREPYNLSLPLNHNNEMGDAGASCLSKHTPHSWLHPEPLPLAWISSPSSPSAAPKPPLLSASAAASPAHGKADS